MPFNWVLPVAIKKWTEELQEESRPFHFLLLSPCCSTYLDGRLEIRYADEAYYVGFRVGDQEIGLDPNGHNQGMTGPLDYFHVSDIKNSLQSLLDAGVQVQQEVTDVGGGKPIAWVKDADSNIIGLLQLP